MCGFAGIIRLSADSSERVDRGMLDRMAAQLVHRGPDASGLYLDNHVGMAHRRLSIIDIESGQQPMQSSDGQVVLAFNGEIFNFVELRAELEKTGASFCTRSDTEVILQLYLNRGMDFVSQLNGQFSIALWDRRSRSLHLIRDRVGICPLFYTVDNGRLVFGSEIKALRPALGRSLRLSAGSLNEVFTFWAPLSPNTAFEGVYELPPGHTMSVADGNTSIRQYWDWPVPTMDYGPVNEEQLAGELHDHLVDATKIRLRADVPVGAYLSGGLDSSAIVSLILNHSDSRLRTFSLTFAEKEFDESAYQQACVDHNRVAHSEVEASRQAIGDRLFSTVWHTEMPILRTAPVPMGMLSGHVRQSGYKVVLTGEGADEVLGGYDIFKEAKVRQFWARQPTSQSRPLLLKKLYPYLTLPKGKGAAFLKGFFGVGIDRPDSVGFSHLPRWQSTGKARMFFSSDLHAIVVKDATERYVASLPDELTTTDPFNRAQYIESKTMMSSYLLSSQGDRMLMMNSVEGRFPFLDHRVIEFASRIPPRLKMKVLKEKYLLKQALAKYLPASIVERSKQPYRAPDAKYLGGDDVAPQVLDALSPSSLARYGLFDAKKVGLLQKKAATGGHLSLAESQAISGIVTTQMICEHFC